MKFFGKCVLVLSMLASLTGCASSGGEQSELNMVQVRMVIPVSQADEAVVVEKEEQINAVIKEELGAEISFVNVPFRSYEKRIRTLRATNEQVDILCLMNTVYTEMWMSHHLMDLSDLIQENGQDIISLLGEEVISYNKINQNLYGIMNSRDYAVTTDTYYLNVKMLESYGYHVSDIEAMDDLIGVLKEIHVRNPEEVLMTCSTTSTIASNQMNVSLLKEVPFDCLNEDDVFVSYLDSEEYKNTLQRIYTWNQDGLISMRLVDDGVKALSDTPLVSVRLGKPGGDAEVTRMRGQEYVSVSFGNDVVDQESYSLVTYGISENCNDSVLAMKVLNLLYRDREINRLLADVMPLWTVPDIFKTDLQQNDPEDLWEQTIAYNANAQKTQDVGFTFDPTPVMEEYLACKQIYSLYSPLLENGFGEMDELLKQMNDELKDAGLDAYIAEKNRQYQLWKQMS